MMEYFRKYLISLRRAENDGLFWNLPIALLIASIIGMGMGLLLDLFLPNGFFTNMIRGVIAIITGVTLFSWGYLFTSKRTDKKRLADSYYQPVRERFSYRQRVNFSIAVMVILVMFVLLGNEDSLVFTLMAIILISTSLTLLAFTRRQRSEFIKDIYDLPDIKDLKSAARKRKLKQELSDDEEDNEKSK